MQNKCMKKNIQNRRFFMRYNVSCDAGNSSIKTLINGDKPMLFENVVADPSGTNYMQNPDLAGAGIQKLDVTINRNFNKSYGKENHFLFGNITEKHNAYRESRTDKLKANDDQLADSILTAIAYSILYHEKKNGENIQNKKTLNVDLTTGLPFHEWVIKEQKERFKKNLQGNHTIKFNHPWFGENSYPEEIEMTVNISNILVEGETTASLILSDTDNEFQKYSPKKILGKIVVLIDIGAYTTEVIGKQFIRLIEEDEDFLSKYESKETIVTHETLPTLSMGIERGIGHIYESTIKSIKQKYPKVDKLIIQDLENALGSDGTIDGKPGNLIGLDINILEDFKVHARNYADYIAKQIENIYNKNKNKNKITRIYLSGGGSQIDVIVKQIKEALKKDDIDPSKIAIVTDPNPVFANCFGYYIENKQMQEDLETEGEMVI